MASKWVSVASPTSPPVLELGIVQLMREWAHAIATSLKKNSTRCLLVAHQGQTEGLVQSMLSAMALLHLL